MRTLDPDLVTMSRVLDAPDRPTWFVDWSGLDSWGIAGAARLEAVVEHRYRHVATVCGRAVWLDRTAVRDLSTAPDCP